MTAPCPNDCHGQPIPCWNPGGPCPPRRDVCEMCGECAYCRHVATTAAQRWAMFVRKSGLDLERRWPGYNRPVAIKPAFRGRRHGW